ncbi:MAG TPA: replication endonuclease [Ochrobactrum intermedium]|uniref:Replication endonuclease n=1 Tax=Brucella intermedia TaxID=94625 RepID=A0A7V6P8M4_9HYPH|nr:replication endonuclease [Brucella intermedia]
MTRPLETPVFSTQNSLPQEAKFVDEAPAGKSFLAQRLAAAPLLGRGFFRKEFEGGFNAGGSVGGIADRTYEEWEKRRDAEWGCVDPEDRLRDDLSALDEEERNKVYIRSYVAPNATELPLSERTHKDVIKFLPLEWQPFLEKMSDARREEREQAILRKVGWDGLNILCLRADALAERAKKKAAAYSFKFPAHDDDGNLINQEPEHRKGRCEKRTRRKLKKLQMRALLYVEAAIGAVGGPNVDGRPLYVSDYLAILHGEHLERTEEVLKGLRLIQKRDPKIQIPMAELNEKAKIADVTKRRLLIDVHLKRWEMLKWHVCWITITLPGQYVCHSTNEANRATDWDTDLGPMEGLDAMQEDYHRAMSILRERGVRPCGWWNAQPQQSGTIHRHIVFACQTQDDAREVCEVFRSKFSTRLESDGGQDRGCAAYVIGDDDENFALPEGRNGQAQTAESVARYTARYSTKLETKKPAQENAEDGLQMPSDLGRAAAWKWSRRIRGHNWVGMDAGRAPMELWDTAWRNALRSFDNPDDDRTAVGLQCIRKAQQHTELLMEYRNELKGLTDEDEKEEQNALIAEQSDCIAFESWHAAIALGIWPDADLHEAERLWLADAIAERKAERQAEKGRIFYEGNAYALPPVPLRECRETAYGETRKTVTGIVCAVERFTIPQKPTMMEIYRAAEVIGLTDEFEAEYAARLEKRKSKGSIVLARRVFFALAKQARFGFCKTHDSQLIGYDRSGEILLKTEEEWVIVDKATAEKMVVEFDEANASNQLRKTKKTVGLSLSPTDPRRWGLTPHLLGGLVLSTKFLSEKREIPPKS